MKSFRLFRGLPVLSCLSFLLRDAAEAFTLQAAVPQGHKETYLHGGRLKRCTKHFSSSQEEPQSLQDRRSAVSNILAASAISAGSWGAQPKISNAAVGTLPEFSDTNAIMQGITVTVADKSQQDAMIAFLIDSFDFKVLRQSVTGPVTDVWLGFGPEQLSIPNDFELPVSAFSKYGGHAAIHLQYNANALSPTFRTGEDTSKNNIAYLQVGVPTYRISQMVANGGNVLDAYGIVNVISPCGLPMRGIVGIRADPMMLVAINCQNVKESAQFYQQLGFVEQPFPYARPGEGKGQFEPPQPDKSMYLAPSPYSMGVLLLQAKDKRKAVVPNKSVRGLSIVYAPSTGGDDSGVSSISDPSDVSVMFTSVQSFEEQEKSTRTG